MGTSDATILNRLTYINYFIHSEKSSTTSTFLDVLSEDDIPHGT